MRRRALALAAALLVAAAMPAPALAACPRTNVADIEDEVMCPVCGTSLALAQEAPQADRQRAFIQRRIDRCQTKEQIKAALAAEYGDDVLAVPDARGFDLTAYLVPALALLAALGAVALAALRWRRSRPAAPARPPAGDAAEAGDRTAADRLETDLGRYDL